MEFKQVQALDFWTNCDPAFRSQSNHLFDGSGSQEFKIDALGIGSAGI
jgi:hypothetical protein